MSKMSVDRKSKFNQFWIKAEPFFSSHFGTPFMMSRVIWKKHVLYTSTESQSADVDQNSYGHQNCIPTSCVLSKWAWKSRQIPESNKFSFHFI